MIQRHEEEDGFWFPDYSCPHCKTEYMATGCYETDQGKQECAVCEEVLYVEIEYDPVYSARKVNSGVSKTEEEG